MITPEDFANDVDFWNAGVAATTEAVDKLNASPKSDDTVRVLRYFLDRVTMTARVLQTLAQHLQGTNYTNDALSLLRTAWDISLQAMWLVHDSAKTPELATDYFAFAEIERMKMINSTHSSSSEFAERLVQSPRRASSEAAINAAYDKAKARFQTSNGRLPQGWYRHDLRTIADKLGLREEYDFMIRGLHGSIHATPWNMLHGPSVELKYVTFCVWQALLRVLDANARYHQLDLSSGVKDILDDARKDMIKTLPATGATP